MFGPKIKISDALYERLQKAAAEKGYSSAEEYAVHILEKAVGDNDDALSEEQVKERLKGLGYVE
jgi:predicted DNA-binding protein